MSFWHPKRAIPKLSDLVIDTDKDWLGYMIKNLGAIQIPRDADPTTLLEGLLWFNKTTKEWKYSPDGTNIKSLALQTITRVRFDATKSVSVSDGGTSGTFWSSEVTIFEDYLQSRDGTTLDLIPSGVLRAKVTALHAPEPETYAKAYLRIYLEGTKIHEQTCLAKGLYDTAEKTVDCSLTSFSGKDISGYVMPKIKITLQVQIYSQYGKYVSGCAIIPAGDIFDFLAKAGIPIITLAVT